MWGVAALRRWSLFSSVYNYIDFKNEESDKVFDMFDSTILANLSMFTLGVVYSFTFLSIYKSF